MRLLLQNGSFRERARNSENSTRQLKQEQKKKVVNRAYEQMDEFEEHLLLVEAEAAREMDDEFFSRFFETEGRHEGRQ